MTTIEEIVSHRCILSKTHKTARGDLLDWNLWKFAQDLWICRALAIVVIGCVQSAKSEFSLANALSYVTYDSKLNVLYILPTDKLVTRFVQGRFDQTVDETPSYKKKLSESSVDRVGLKKFNGMLSFTTSQSKAGMKEFNADLVTIDEMDDCDADNVKLSFDRLAASAIKASVIIGNPSLVDSPLDRSYRESNQQHWEIRCPDCRKWQDLDWHKQVIKSTDDLNWTYRSPREIPEAVCFSCKATLNLRADGEWIAEDKGNPVSGFQISHMMSPLQNIPEMMKDAKQRGYSDACGNPGAMGLFYNSRLGKPYTAVGSQITPDMIAEHTGEHGCVREWSGEATYAGVDPGGVFSTCIARRMGDQWWVIAWDKAMNWEDLTQMLRRYNVSHVVIDARPEEHACERWQKEMRGEMTVIRRQSTEPTHSKPPDFDEDLGIVKINRVWWLDNCLSEIKSGNVVFPRGMASEPIGELCKNARYIRTNDKGVQKSDWGKAKPDHFHSALSDLLLHDGAPGGNTMDMWGQIQTVGRRQEKW